MRSKSVFTLHPALLLCTAHECFSHPSYHISGQNKMFVILCLEFSSPTILFFYQKQEKLKLPCKQPPILFSQDKSESEL